MLAIVSRRVNLEALGGYARIPSLGMFTPEDLEELTYVLQSARLTAELLGRLRMRERRETVVERLREVQRFADPPIELPSPMSISTPVGIIPLEPERAVEYFVQLAPQLNVNPQRILAESRRDAFTLARATTQQLLVRLQREIGDRLRTGRIAEGTQSIQTILDNAGVGGGNPQYAEMVFRTNAMDAYNTGSMAEIQAPDMRNFFPAWQYLGIPDGREGDDHRIHFGNYYPVSVPFADIRGPRVFNCRCTFRAVDLLEWQELVRRGVDYAI